jgi:putative FmdB family regulatory protein
VPIYDYVCASCRHRLEVIHRIDDAGPRFCPNCGAEGTLHKALTSPAIHFKGSGWAKKDRSATSGSRAKSSADSSRDGSGSGSTDTASSDGGGSSDKSDAPSKDTSKDTSKEGSKDGAKRASDSASASKD